MDNICRTVVAGSALVFAILVMTVGVHPEVIGAQTPLMMIALFIHGWIIAVGERASVAHGGDFIKRAPLAPRLVGTRRSLLAQTLVLATLVGVCAFDHRVGLAAVGVTLVLSLELLRSVAPYALAAFLPIYGLATMAEFHTLSDLVVTAQNWITQLATALAVAVVLSGTLMRSDASRLPTPAARAVAWIAGLPGYLLAPFVLHKVPGLASWGPLYATLLVLLVGGLVQTAIASIVGRTIGVEDRDPRSLPVVAAVMMLAGAFSYVDVPEALLHDAPVPSWIGLMALLIAVPTVPALALVAAQLDRIDTRRLPWIVTPIAVASLVGWMLLGPGITAWLYAPDGPLVSSAKALHLAPGAVLLAQVSGDDVRLANLPITRMLQGCTLMMLTSGLLCARLVRRSTTADGGVGPLIAGLLVALTALLSALLMPRLGLAGAPIAAAAASGLLLLADQARSMGTEAIDVEEEEVSIVDTWHAEADAAERATAPSIR